MVRITGPEEAPRVVGGVLRLPGAVRARPEDFGADIGRGLGTLGRSALDTAGLAARRDAALADRRRAERVARQQELAAIEPDAARAMVTSQVMLKSADVLARAKAELDPAAPDFVDQVAARLDRLRGGVLAQLAQRHRFGRNQLDALDRGARALQEAHLETARRDGHNARVTRVINDADGELGALLDAVRQGTILPETARAAASGHLDVLRRVMSPTAPEAFAKSFESRLALADLSGLAERNPAAVLTALDAGTLTSVGLDKADMAKVRDVALQARDAAAAVTQGTPAATDPRAPVTQTADAGKGGVAKGEAVVSDSGQQPVDSRSDTQDMSVEGKSTSADRKNQRNRTQEQRNPVLERAGFRFVTDDKGEGGRWVGPDGKPASPTELRDLVSEKIRRRAEQKSWSASRTLAELYKARAGLPFNDQNNIEVAFWFLPFIGAAGTEAAVGSAIAIGSEALGAVLGGLGLAGVLSLSGDTSKEGNRGRKKSIPVPQIREKTNERDQETVVVYRVEGVPNTRVLIDKSGFVHIVGRDNKVLFLNFGQRIRAEKLFQRRILQNMPGVEIKSFKVHKTFLESLRERAVSESNIRGTDKKNRPIRVDEKIVPDQFGLREPDIKALRNFLIQGTGKIRR